MLSENAKKRFKKKFKVFIKDLRSNPHIYQCFDKEIDSNIRRGIINRYIVFYKIDLLNITILRILPEKFDYLNHLDNYKILIQK